LHLSGMAWRAAALAPCRTLPLLSYKYREARYASPGASSCWSMTERCYLQPHYMVHYMVESESVGVSLSTGSQCAALANTLYHGRAAFGRRDPGSISPAAGPTKGIPERNQKNRLQNICLQRTHWAWRKWMAAEDKPQPSRHPGWNLLAPASASGVPLA
jgi:hypothetical protein